MSDEQVVLTRGHDGRFYSPDGVVVELNRPEKRPEGSAVRHKVSGDLGHRFRANGQELVRYDRPGQELVKTYKEDEWIEIEYQKTLAPIAIALTCYAADAELAKHLAERSKKEWGLMTNQERLAWVSAVETGNAPYGLQGPRKSLFEAMVAEMKWLLE